MLQVDHKSSCHVSPTKDRRCVYGQRSRRVNKYCGTALYATRALAMTFPNLDNPVRTTTCSPPIINSNHTRKSSAANRPVQFVTNRAVVLPRPRRDAAKRAYIRRLPVRASSWETRQAPNGFPWNLVFVGVVQQRGAKWFVLLTQYRAGDKIEKS